MNIQIKRIYDPPSDDDGLRVLVDRLWPRGLKKTEACVDHWAKELSPSTDLRRWFGHDPSRFAEFRRRYLKELEGKAEAVRDVVAAAAGQTVTLLFAARDRLCNHAVVLRDVLTKTEKA